MKSLLIRDTTRQQREQIIHEALSCGGGCENCASCWLGAGRPEQLYKPYIDGEMEISEINAQYRTNYLH